MSNNKQSSIDWLVKELGKTDIGRNLLEQSYNKDLINKAKARHKKEIIDAWAHGVLAKNSDTAEQYYNETYNND